MRIAGGRKIPNVAASAPEHAAHLVADEPGRDQHRPRSDLAEGDPVAELREGEPLHLVDHHMLEQGDRCEPAPEGQQSDLEEGEEQGPRVRAGQRSRDEDAGSDERARTGRGASTCRMDVARPGRRPGGDVAATQPPEQGDPQHPREKDQPDEVDPEDQRPDEGGCGDQEAEQYASAASGEHGRAQREGRRQEQGHDECTQADEEGLDEAQLPVGEVRPGQQQDCRDRGREEHQREHQGAEVAVPAVAEVAHRRDTGRPGEDLGEAHGLEELVLGEPPALGDEDVAQVGERRRPAVADRADVEHLDEHGPE